MVETPRLEAKPNEPKCEQTEHEPVKSRYQEFFNAILDSCFRRNDEKTGNERRGRLQVDLLFRTPRPTGKGRLALLFRDHHILFDMVPLHFTTEGASIDPEKHSSLDLIPLCLLEGPEDQPLFEDGDHIQVL